MSAKKFKRRVVSLALGLGLFVSSQSGQARSILFAECDEPNPGSIDFVELYSEEWIAPLIEIILERHPKSIEIKPPNSLAATKDGLAKSLIDPIRYLETEIFDYALVLSYLDRFLSRNDQLSFHSYNFYKLVIIAATLTSKINDDNSPRISEVAFVAGIHSREMSWLEKEFLKSLKFSLQIPDNEIIQNVRALVTKRAPGPCFKTNSLSILIQTNSDPEISGWSTKLKTKEEIQRRYLTADQETYINPRAPFTSVSYWRGNRPGFFFAGQANRGFSYFNQNGSPLPANQNPIEVFAPQPKTGVENQNFWIYSSIDHRFTIEIHPNSPILIAKTEQLSLNRIKKTILGFFSTHEDLIISSDFSPLSNRLATVGRRGHLRFYDFSQIFSWY